MFDSAQSILNGPTVAVSTLSAYLAKRAARRPTAERDAIVYAFTTFGQLTSIGNVLPLAQAIHETACFLSPRWIGSFNPAGLGATNDGAWGKTFATPAEGILAQYAHLLSYALADGRGTFAQQRLSMYFDPRRTAMGNAKGCAPTWRGLNGRWAVPGTTYAEKIIEIANAIVTSGGL